MSKGWLNFRMSLEFGSLEPQTFIGARSSLIPAGLPSGKAKTRDFLGAGGHSSLEYTAPNKRPCSEQGPLIATSMSHERQCPRAHSSDDSCGKSLLSL